MPTVHRLFVPEPLRAGAELRLDADRSHYVARVLRVRAGDALVLFDGSGHEHPSSVASVARQGVTVSVGAARAGRPESPLRVHLLQGVSRGERMDWVVQKATELGVARITPVVTEFSVVRLDDRRAGRRARHWERIAAGACEQCGRSVLPRIDAPRSFADALAEAAAGGGSKLVLHAASREALGAREAMTDRLALLIGPEGGLSAAELASSEEAGFLSRALGPRILRTETAAVAALAVLQSRFGDLR